MAEKRIAIGIDLGTTYSCVAVYQNDRIEIIANDMGNRITPSYVAFTEVERHIGDAAKEQIAQNSHNTVFNTKRLIGRKFDDEDVQKDIKNGSFPFTVKEFNEKPLIEVTYKGVPKQLTPEEISSMVLGKMKECAEAYTGLEITDAVVTVPAYFNDSQRQATKDAGAIAGLNVLSIINEPTAAAIAYGFNKNITEDKNVLIFDLGGGTFDVVIICMSNGVFDVKVVAGDTHLGGEDFDKRLVDHFVAEYKRKNSRDITSDARAMQRLKKTCEKAKRVLSSATKANIDIDCLFGGMDFHSTITRVRFDELCSDLFLKTISLVEKTLDDAGMDKDDLDEIVLVGGSTRIAKIQELLKAFFDGRKLNMGIHPDEAVAHGAAVHAAVLVGQIPEKEVSLMDVAPLSLGIETFGGFMNTIIKRNTRIPSKQTKRDFTTCKDNQENLNIQVYEGERKQTSENHPLGSFILSEIQKAARGIPSIDVTFELDSNGILQVSALDRATRSTQSIAIVTNKGQLSDADISRMVEDSKQLNEEDRRIREITLLRSNLESYCFKIKSTMQSKGKSSLASGSSTMTEEQMEEAVEISDQTIDWLDDNQDAEKEDLEEKQKEVEEVCGPILAMLEQ